MTEIADAVHPVRPDGRRNSGAVRPAQAKHGEIAGHITDGEIGARRAIVANPGQVTFHRIGADHRQCQFTFSYVSR